MAKKRHKWHALGQLPEWVCLKCELHKKRVTKGLLYTDKDGNESERAPECIELDLRKKYRHGKALDNATFAGDSPESIDGRHIQHKSPMGGR